jgi:CheY-like chemotaxis protein
MEALGRLAGGVAHDFNNLLTVIHSYADFLLENPQADQEIQADAQEIRRAAEQAEGLTQQLLAFSRKQILQPHVLNLNQVVQDMEKMLRRLLGEQIQVEVHLAEGLGSVRADPGQLGQVIINMAVNAQDAMPHGGRLVLRTGNIYLGEEETSSRLKLQPGAYVVLSISDTGMGMDQATQEHLFEPFFTTKQDGTGLGLATAYGIVTQSGGDIHVYSEPDQGTTFKIYLPQVTAEPDQSIQEVKVLPRGQATILLVEDEVIVRQLARRILQRQGYTVLEADGGAEALEIFAAHGPDIDLLLTDVVMPYMTGPELVQRLLDERPNLSVLYMSGYTGDVITQHGVSVGEGPYLEKPFTPATLSQRVYEILGNA